VGSMVAIMSPPRRSEAHKSMAAVKDVSLSCGVGGGFTAGNRLSTLRGLF